MIETNTTQTDYTTILFSAVVSVALSVTAVSFLIKSGKLTPEAPQQAQQQTVVVLDALAASQAIAPSDPLYDQKIEQLMVDADKMANDLAAQGFIVLDGRSVLRAPVSKVILPEIKK